MREPASLTAALTAMVEENAIRADISPWEQGRVAVLARDADLFPTIEEAVDSLYPSVNRAKRSRIRTFARIAETLDGLLTAPETLSQRQMLRIADALRHGYTDVITTALTEASARSPESQWQILLPILTECETPEPANAPPPRPGRPRRVLTPRRGVTIRREMTRDGWILRFTGPEATGMMLDTVMDEIERMYGPG